MASRAYKPEEYFRRPVVAKLFEQSSKQSEDNSVDISKKDIDDHELVVDESTIESRSTRKDMEEGLPREKSKNSQGKRKASFATALCDQDSAKFSLGDKMALLRTCLIRRIATLYWAATCSAIRSCRRFSIRGYDSKNPQH